MTNNQNYSSDPLPQFPATPQRLPRPTYFPFFLALGISFIFWGLVTSFWISAVGLIVFIIAL